MPQQELPNDHREFESFCADLCAQLQLGTPIHLAEGPDRGKDIVVNARLRSGGARVHIECKHSKKKQSIGSAAIKTADQWASAESADLLILMTNRPITAGLEAWITNTAARRNFPILIWDNEFLINLQERLADSSSRIQLSKRIKRELEYAIESHSKILDESIADSRLFEAIEPTPLPDLTNFVDRKTEIQKLAATDQYRTALISGPPGIGKSLLGAHALVSAEARGFAPVVISQEGLDQYDPLSVALPIVSVLTHRLLNQEAPRNLQKVARSQLGIQNRLSSFLKQHSLCILFEDVHSIESGSPYSQILITLLQNPGKSRIVMTTRSSLPPFWKYSPDLTVEVGTFSHEATAEFLKKRLPNTPADLIDLLGKKLEGWPLMLSLAASSHGDTLARDDLREQTFDRLQSYLLSELLKNLSTAARRVLTYIIHLKTRFSVYELSGLLECDESLVLDAMDELLKSGILRINSLAPDSVHALLKKELKISLNRSQEIEFSLGTVLENYPNDPASLIASAKHFQEAHDLRRSVGLMYAQSERIFRSGKFASVLDWASRVNIADLKSSEQMKLGLLKIRAQEEIGDYRAAYQYASVLDFLKNDSSIDYVLRGRFHYQEARLLYHLGEFGHSEDNLNSVLQILSSQRAISGDDSQLLKAQCFYLKSRISYIRRDLNLCEELLWTAKKVGPSRDSLFQNKISHRFAMLKLKRGEISDAQSSFEKVCLLARELGDRKRESYALQRLAIIERQRGKLDRSLKLTRESLRIKIEIGHRRGEVYSKIEEARVLRHMNDLDSGTQACRDALKLASELQLPRETLVAKGLLAEIYTLQGKVGAASILRTEVVNGFARLGLPKRAERVEARLMRCQEESKGN